MTETSSSLADLVQMLNDGVDFYLGAAGKVGDPALIECFQRMSFLKKTIASDLNAEIALEGDKPRESGTLAGAIRKGYADLLAKFGDDNARQYISQLEEHEDRMLAAFREALLSDPSSRVRELALLYFPEIEKMHADMRRLKHERRDG